jgi:hypothetical protein
MKIESAVFGECRAGFVSKPAIAILKGLAGKDKALVHPPVRAVHMIMVAQNQDPASREFGHYVLDFTPVTNSYVTKV